MTSLAGSAAADVTVPGNYGSIQAAINAVVNGSLPDGTTINVQPGTYFEALTIANTTRSLTLRGLGGAAGTIVDAQGRNAASLTIVAASGQIVVRGLTFRHGSQPSTSGGGFVIGQASPSLVDCIFESSSAFRGGGGYMWASNATFTGCTIRFNTAQHFGGGVYIVGGSRPIFTACDISSNAAGTGGPGVGNNGAGGGVFSHDSSPTLRGSRVNGNTAKFAAAGIFQMGVAGSAAGVAALVVEDSEIADNVASQFSSSDNPSEGGGIHVEENATATLTRVRVLRNRANTGAGLNAYRARYDIVDSIIEANVAAPTASQPTATGFGGGIAATSNNPPGQPAGPASVVYLTRTLVRNNTATVTGGGIAVFGDAYSTLAATLSLTGSVVSGNQSQSQGGGVLISRTSAGFSDSLIIGNTVSGGSLPFGGGLLMTTGSAATVIGTTFAGNTASLYGGGIFMDAGSNLQMNGSRLYANSASANGGGGLFVGGNGNSSGAVRNSILADNSGYQIVEHLCQQTGLTYQNNTITPRSGSSDLYFGNCAGSIQSISQFNSSPTGRASGNTSGVPRFAHFLAAPAAGIRMALAWSVARPNAGNSISISGVGSFAQHSGTADVSPSATTNYSLTAATASGSIGPVTITATVVQPPAAPVFRSVAGDFNGDGKADIAIFRPSTSVWYIQNNAPYSWGGGGDIPLSGDFDGDGRADIGVFRPSNSTWYIVRSSTQTGVTYLWGGGGDIPVPGDYDGDNRTDVAIFRPSASTWYILRSSDQTGVTTRWGGGGDIPAPGDYDADGRTDIAVFRPSTGFWYIVSSRTQTGSSYQWGGGGDIPVQADYDGDGRTDIGIFRPTTGTWHIVRSSTQAGFTQTWGGGGDVPVPGDYDGDGKIDIAVFRPSTGAWYIIQSGGQPAPAVTWGGRGDLPILAR